MANVFVEPNWQSSADPGNIRRRGHSMYCRLWSEDHKVLHQFAARIGAGDELFVPQPAHYELSPERRRLAVAFGAEERMMPAKKKPGTVTHAGVIGSAAAQDRT